MQAAACDCVCDPRGCCGWVTPCRGATCAGRGGCAPCLCTLRVSSACRLCLLKRCVCGCLQAVFACGVRAHTRVDKFVGLQIA